MLMLCLQKLIKRTVFTDHLTLLTERQDVLLAQLATLAKDGFEKAKEEWERSVVAWGASNAYTYPVYSLILSFPLPPPVLLLFAHISTFFCSFTHRPAAREIAVGSGRGEHGDRVRRTYTAPDGGNGRRWRCCIAGRRRRTE